MFSCFYWCFLLLFVVSLQVSMFSSSFLFFKYFLLSIVTIYNSFSHLLGWRETIPSAFSTSITGVVGLYSCLDQISQ
jgi:hypothetical protein